MAANGVLALAGARELGVEPFSFVTVGHLDARTRGRDDPGDPRRERRAVRASRGRRGRGHGQRPDHPDDADLLRQAPDAPRPAERFPRLVGGAAFADRRAPGAHRGFGRVPGPRRRAARPAPLASRPTTTTTRSPSSSPRPASCTSAAGSTRRSDGRDHRRHGPRAARPTSATTAVRGGRRRRPATTGPCACSTSRSTVRRGARAARRASGSSASAGSPMTTTAAPPASDRGAREADRRRRRASRTCLAQGLLARHALLPLLRPHRRHLGDRRRRRVGTARASCRVRTARSCSRRSYRSAGDCRSATCRPRPATSPCTARCTLHMSHPPVERRAPRALHGVLATAEFGRCFGASGRRLGGAASRRTGGSRSRRVRWRRAAARRPRSGTTNVPVPRASRRRREARRPPRCSVVPARSTWCRPHRSTTTTRCARTATRAPPPPT